MLQQGNQINTKTKQQPKRWTRKYQQQSFSQKGCQCGAQVRMVKREGMSREKNHTPRAPAIILAREL